MNRSPKRKSYIQSLSPDYICDKKDLSNESSVETFFISRLIELLGYEDKYIKTKKYIKTNSISLGRKKILYSPDYILHNKKDIPVLIIDAKSTKEDIANYLGQVSSYTLEFFRKYKTNLFLISNGLKTNLYKIDSEQPLLKINFDEIFIGSEKLEILKNYISFEVLSSEKKEKIKEIYITLKSLTKEEAKKLFSKCHKKIWNAEKRSPHSAFIEFVKLIFVKLYNDRLLHEAHTLSNNEISVMELSNRFSIKWIEKQEEPYSKEKKELSNPVKDILFKELFDKIKDDIDKNKKKTIFEDYETIALKPSTIKLIVKELETFDLFGIDEDLNGRLFETFLNATMRGQALGQYFTPRSIVLLGTYLSDLRSEKNNFDKVIDASCGTGGFLIEAFTIMRQKIRENSSYTDKEKHSYIDYITKNCIYGIDAAREPDLYKIARINMFLHGDGGSHIYYGDGLNNETQVDITENRLLQNETRDMVDCIKNESFDVVLTNPPFSMWYDIDNPTQKKILEQYSLLYKDNNIKRNRLRGSALFIERYYNLLKTGGKLITVIDDAVLESEDFSFFRNFIREKFIVKAVISLHGDAFQMAKARVKTSLLYLVKKENDEKQPNVFMYPSLYLGVDDLPVTTPPEKIEKARKRAEEEIETILKKYKEFEKGVNNPYSIPSNRTKDRLDVKFCTKKDFNHIWISKKFTTSKVRDFLSLREDYLYPQKDEYKNKKFSLLKIQYDGKCSIQEERKGKNIKYAKLISVKETNLVFSEYNTFHGAIGYITKSFENYLASGSYLVTESNNYYDTLYLWHLLRKTDFRIQVLIDSVGMGRKTISWDTLKNVEFPLIEKNQRKAIADKILEIWSNEEKAFQEMEMLNNNTINKFDLEKKELQNQFESMKPPK